MAIKYVRKSGSDSNNGNSALTAYLTIGKLLQNLSAGDYGYIGAGVYRESGLSFTNNGSSGNLITLKGDIDGSQTNDAGIVRITASSNDNAFTNANVFNLASGNAFIVFDSLWMDMSSSNVLNANNVNNNSITVQNCWITNAKGEGINIQGSSGVVRNCRVWNLRTCDKAIYLAGGSGTVTNCYVEGIRGSGTCEGIVVQTATGQLTTTVNNCYVNLIRADGGAPDDGIHFAINSIVNAVYNCYNNTVVNLNPGGANTIYGIFIDNNVASTSGNIFNNYIQNAYVDAGTNNDYAIGLQNAVGTTNGDYNAWTDCRDGVLNYTVNTHDRNNNGNVLLVPPLPSGTAGFQMGYYVDVTSSGYDNGANTPLIPTVDMMGNPRPGSFGTDIGAFEKQGFIASDSATSNLAPPATSISGCGYYDYQFVVNNTKTMTIKAYIKTNASYTGTQPSLTVLPNNTNQSGTVSYTGVSNAWQQVTIPTAAMLASANGIITVRFQTYSVAANSTAWIDDITLSEA